MEYSITLTEDLFIGMGGCKKTYYHPENKGLVIKIVHADPPDLMRELAYRRALKVRNKSVPEMMTKYYGTVQTNLGLGYVFECISDYDGKLSCNLKDYLFAISPKKDGTQDEEKIYQLLKGLRDEWEREILVSSDDDITNFMIQKVSPSEFRYRIIDNVGTKGFIPLAIWSDWIAKRRINRYWLRIIKRINYWRKDFLKGELLERLVALNH